MYSRLRSTGGTSRLEFARTRDAVNTYARQFSTTNFDAAPPPNDNGGSDKPSPFSSRQDRSRAAAGEINNLLRSASGKAPIDISQRSSSPGGFTKPNVVDIKSTPRGLGQGLRGGRGGFSRGGFSRGGGFRSAPDVTDGAIVRAPSGFTGRFSSPSGRGRGGGRGGPRGLSGRGGRGRGRGNRRGRGGRDGEEEEGDGGGAVSSTIVEELERMATPKTVEEIALDKQYRHGVATPFNPSLTLESLTGYGPAIAADGARAKGESVLQGLRTLSGGAKYSPAAGSWGIPRQTVNKIKYEQGVYFFSSTEERDHVLSDPAAAARLPGGKLPEPEENVKKAVVDALVRGAYETPGAGSAGFHVRNETWMKSQSDSFEAKVASLVARKAAAPAGGAAQQGKGKKA